MVSPSSRLGSCEKHLSQSMLRVSSLLTASTVMVTPFLLWRVERVGRFLLATCANDRDGPTDRQTVPTEVSMTATSPQTRASLRVGLGQVRRYPSWVWKETQQRLL